MTQNPLIYNGQVLAEIGPPKRYGGGNDESNKYTRSLKETQKILLRQITNLNDKISSLNTNEKLSNETFFKIDYSNPFLAKTYQVKTLYNKSGLKVVGSARWNDDNEEEGRSDLLRGNQESIRKLSELINSPENDAQIKEVRRMQNIDVFNTFYHEGTSAKEPDFYELIFHSVNDESRDELIIKIDEMLTLAEKKHTIKWLENNVLCVNVSLSPSEANTLLNLNPLRSVYGFGRRDYSLDHLDNQSINDIKINELEDSQNELLPWVGIIDGGVKTQANAFHTVEQLYEVEAPASDELVEHGSSVTSILLYGDLTLKTTVTPEFRVASIRALPSKENDMYDLISLEEIIEETIPKYRNIRLWNLSIGPYGPIQDEFISSLTRLLDDLSYKYDILFIIAAGNTGIEQGIGRRIQIPGDSVNNITVSSYYNNGEILLPAPYNSIGPGREGAKLKPDVLDNGGLMPHHSLITFSTYNYSLNKVEGTSFAAPNITRKLAKILNKYDSFTTLHARALLEHSMSVDIEDDREIPLKGKGDLKEETSLIFTSEENEYRVMYSGEISVSGIVVLPVPLPENYESKKVEITWTTAIKSLINPDTPDKYTVHCIEDDFYPDSYIYKYTNEDGKKEVVDSSTSNSDIETLLENGYSRSPYPERKESKKYINESERRVEKLKWDTVKTQRTRKMAKSLNNPFIRLQALSRGNSLDRIKYVMVLTVKLKDDVDVQNEILSRYNQLQDVTMLNRVKIDKN